MIDPVVDSYKPLATSSVGPVPTVVPGHPPIIQEGTKVGHRGLWVVAVLMFLSSLVFYILAARVPVQKRLFHVLISLVTTISFLSYFAMATGDGINYNLVRIHETHKKALDTTQEIFRQVYWARFVNWGLTTPLILITLALLAGLNGANLLIAISADLVMVISGLISSYGGHNGRRWAWFTIACVGYLTVVYKIGYQGRRAVSSKDNRTRSFYSSIAGYSLIVMLIYPVIWAASTNARKMSVDAEIVVYAILDVLLQGVFGYWLLISHDSTPAIAVNSEGFWSHGLDSGGTIRIGEEETA